MGENIDIYDANLKHLGVMDRLEAHRNACWHKTFHCWVVTGKGGAVLFQLRSPEMANFPNLLDVSAAGHLEAGETLEEGIREVSEELGIPLPMNALHQLGYRVEVADQKNGQKNREYQAVYMANVDLPLTEYQPQVEEVSGLLWLDVQDGIGLFSGVKKKATMRGIRYDSDKKRWEPATRAVTSRDFLPRIQQYYLTICIMAERLAENRSPLSIS